MKKITFFCTLFVIVGFVSCNRKQSQNSNEEQILEEKPVSVQCYISSFEKDTIDLKINTLKDGKISGNMEMKLLDMPIKTGKIAGEFRGDTLFVDYSFIQGTNEKVVFKNPMAFLKKENELTLGNGKIVTYMGASYFAKGEKIDFENVKYKFIQTDCSEK
jgi:hypothetical protein